MKGSIPIILLAAALLLLPPATSYGGDAVEGERFARRACAFCHAVANGPSPMADAPPFATIARSKKFRVQGVRLVTGNRLKMPIFAFTDEQAEDITAYLQTLASRPNLY